MSEAIKPTPGPWTVSGLGGPWEQSLKIRAPSWGLVAQIGVNPGMPHWDLPQRANAALIAEAGNVFHETGLTPRQLVEQRDALAEALLQTTDVYEAMRSKLAEMYPQDGWSAETMTIDQARAALALVKGAKP